MSVAFLGLGIMGGHMASRIVSAGINVKGWNRSLDRPSVKLAEERGVLICDDPQQAIDGTDVICLCLSDGVAVLETLKLLSPHPMDGNIILDFSTIGVEPARQALSIMHELGATYIDSPVTGGDLGASNGTLTVMMGHPECPSPKVAKILSAIASKTVYCGNVGSGQMLKLINQQQVLFNLFGVAQAIRLSKTAGLDPALILEACGDGAGGSWQLRNLAPKALKEDYSPGFKASHLLKDALLLKQVCDHPDLKKTSDICDYLAGKISKNPSLGDLGTQALMSVG